MIYPRVIKPKDQEEEVVLCSAHTLDLVRNTMGDEIANILYEEREEVVEELREKVSDTQRLYNSELRKARFLSRYIGKLNTLFHSPDLKEVFENTLAEALTFIEEEIEDV